jgi:hypothetical protein
MVESNSMGKYQSGDHVKFEVVDDHSGESEWMWLLVDDSDDERELVFGKLDSQPIVATDMRLGQEPREGRCATTEGSPTELRRDVISGLRAARQCYNPKRNLPRTTKERR